MGPNSSTWIFQGNPDRFDMDAYLSDGADRITWMVNQHANEIRRGDLVYIWRAAGKKKAVSGIVASAYIDSEVFIGADEPRAHIFWVSGDPTKHSHRVWLSVQRVAGLKGVIRSEWLREDPVCGGLELLKMSQRTNFRVSQIQAKRLEALWHLTGEPWSYAECVAALKIYAETKGQPISRLPDAPVTLLALRIGRALGGAYNKLLNFRAIDPTDERKGLSASSTEDKQVWDAFYDPITKVIRTDLLDAEYARLWPVEETICDSATMTINLESRVEELVKRTEAELKNQWQKRAKNEKPRRIVARTSAFEREPVVVALAKVRSGFRCEIQGCTWPGFQRSDGEAFIEVHHIRPLAEGGEDTPDNAAAVCPGHHRELHHGSKREILRAALLELRRSN